MNFKSFLAAAGFILASISGAIANDVVIVHTGGKTGTNAIIANEYLAEFRKHYKDVQAIGPGGCVPALEYVRRNPNQAVVFLYDVSALGSEPCRDPLLKMKSTAVFGVHHWLCTNATSGLTLRDFLQGGSKVGLSTPFPLWDSWYRDAMKVSNGKPMIGVPVGDSGKLVLSLLSKETDWTLLNGQRAHAQSKEGKLKCVATTNPTGEQGLPYLGTSLPNFARNRVILGWNTVIVNAGADQNKIQGLVKQYHAGSNFKKFADTNLIIDETNSDPKTKDQFYQYMLDYIMPDRKR